MKLATTKEERKKLILNILAIAGLVILIVILIMGLFRMATLAKSWFSSLFGKNSGAIQITVPLSKINSGESATVSWKYSPKESGAYEFLYQCQKGLVLKTPGVADGILNAIPCGSAYKIPGVKNSIDITPILSDTSSTNLPISIIFVPTAVTGTQAQGSATLQIGSGQSTATLPAIKSTVEIAPASPAKQPAVKAYVPKTTDLSVNILSVGVLDPITGNTIPREPMSQNEQVAVRFMIANHGNTSTGHWYFTAQLPTSAGNNTYTSPMQAPLAPGASIENMLRFTYAIPGGLFVVSVDPANQVNESNENNNYARTNI
ncbi:MAG: hypothetical protein NUV88_01385 [Candidatus Kaiserbacteria bacterium]|nr:hypothetical protein [Candidatus Kaiserbacteria bacterium]